MLAQLHTLLGRERSPEAPPTRQPENTLFNLQEAERQHAAWLNSKKLCLKCEEVFQKWCYRDDWANIVPELRHHCIIDLQTSAQNCPTCELLLNCLESPRLRDSSLKNQITREKIAGRVYVSREAVGAYYSIRSEFGLGGTNSKVKATFDCHLSVSEDEHIGSVTRSTNCDTSSDLLQRWFNDCKGFHGCCEQQVAERELPTRLVFVGANDSQLRLCLSQDLPEETEYLTLSHCWGKKEFATLLSENIDSRLLNIPAASLTKTFKDAIAITRSLGYFYIWIDSLCIIQYEETDWKHEAPLMERVYANSSLNIAASDSLDGDTGCFFDRPTSKVLGWKVQSSGCLLPSKHRHEEPEVPHTWDSMPSSWVWERFDGNLLGKRAWVYQERVLSPRTLHFGSDELSWECRTKLATETFPGGFADGFRTTPGFGPRPDLKGKKDQADISSDWVDIVMSYSAGKLTVATDKLVAISGVARVFASRFGMTYLAGLWKEDLMFGLLWYAHRDRSLKTPTVALRAPTWSWVSIDSQVAYQHPIVFGTHEWLASVDEVVVEAAPDPFVDFKEGFVRIKTDMFSRGWISNLQKPTGEPNFAARIFEKDLGASFVYLDYKDHDVGTEVFYLPILRASEEGHLPELWGLVLQISTFGDFKRVGAFVVRGDKPIEAFTSVLKQMALVDSHLLEGFNIVNEAGNRTYIITII